MKRIMIVEDDSNLQEIYRLNFEAAGFEVLIEGDGLSGISEVTEKMPDIVLLDVMMPNMDGFAFLKAMKENTNIHIPVVVCSNLSDKQTEERARDAGAKDVLLKVDYSGKDLVTRINQILADESGQSA